MSCYSAVTAQPRKTSNLQSLKIPTGQRRAALVSWKSLRQFPPQTATPGSLVLGLVLQSQLIVLTVFSTHGPIVSMAFHKQNRYWQRSVIL
jgi:hypothetical protein